MKTLLLTILLIGCGTDSDEPIEQIVLEESEWEDAEPDTPTMMMCQQATACTADGECFDVEKPVEFAVDDTLIYWQACFNFRPCEGKKFYRDEYCEENQ
jgi:hypothetical protein